VSVMIGSPCSPCCHPCACPEGQSLPSAVTVTFSGLTKSITSKAENLLGVQLSSCFGAGAVATVAANGGTAEEGFPIQSVTLASPGAGYALFGRVAPTLAVAGGSGTGATFTPALSATNDSCGVPSWSLQSVSVTGGTKYVDGEQLSVAFSKGDTEVIPAVAVVRTQRVEPVLQATAAGGSGATFKVSTGIYSFSPASWTVSGVEVTSGGTGYADGAVVSFSGGPQLVVEQAAEAYVVTGRQQPTLSASVNAGSGAVISPVLSPSTDWLGRPIWTVASFTVANGGAGHAEFDSVIVTVTDGQESPYSFFYAYVSAVDENGAVLSIQVEYGGEYYKSTGVVESVAVWLGGSYYEGGGTPSAVDVVDGGKYYREDASLAPYVASVAATITQKAPSDGAGAAVSVTVESNTKSPNFGKIASLSLDSKGDGYLAWSWVTQDCNAAQFNGNSFVLSRTSPTSCSYSRCRGGSKIGVTFRGIDNPPQASITGECTIAFTADESKAPFACDPIKFTAAEVLGGTVSVEAGDAGGIPDCGVLFGATSVTFEISAEDWVDKFYATPRGQLQPNQRNTRYWPGSKYAGTFELTYDRTVTESPRNGAKAFRYYYGGDALFCGRSPYIEFLVRQSPPLMEIYLADATALYHDCVGANCQQKEASDLTCQEIDTQNGLDRIRAGSITSTAFPGLQCPCDPDSFFGARASEPGRSVSSDSVPFSEVQGSLSIGFRFVSYSDE
jgi:hypothetical protein